MIHSPPIPGNQPYAKKPLAKVTKAQWNRIRGGCGGVWKHESGWYVLHCGHPTALWPYYAKSPEGESMVSHNNRGFTSVAYAQVAVEMYLANHPQPEPR